MRTLGSHHRNKQHSDSEVKKIRALLIVSTLHEQLGWEGAGVEKSHGEKGEGNCRAHCYQGKISLSLNKLLNAGMRRGLLALRKSIHSLRKSGTYLSSFMAISKGSVSPSNSTITGAHILEQNINNHFSKHTERRRTATHVPTHVTWTTASKVGGWDPTWANLTCCLMHFGKKIPSGGYRLSFYWNVLVPSLSLC